jgi:hypothetical protein
LGGLNLLGVANLQPASTYYNIVKQCLSIILKSDRLSRLKDKKKKKFKGYSISNLSTKTYFRRITDERS